jgi:chaperonin GroES
MTLNIGDRVLFTSYTGTEVKSTKEEEDLLIMSEDDILAVIR